MAQTFRRPLTAEEQRLLEVMLKPEVARTTGLLGAMMAFGGSLLLFLLALEFYRGYPKVLEFASIAVSLLLGAYVYLKTQRHPARERYAALLRGELERGEAEVASYRIADAIEVEEFEDEGLSFYLRLEDDRVLFLSGQYLYEPVEAREFPSTRVEISRAPATGQLLDFRTSGTYLPSSAKRPPFRDAEYRGEAVPEDGTVLDIDFESLRPVTG